MNMQATAIRQTQSELDRSHRTSQALPSPRRMMEQLPLMSPSRRAIVRHRQEISNILHGQDERLLVIVGPCSIHDEAAALDYGQRLAALAARVEDRMKLVMRAYLEKPRTTVGWKGLLYDPQRDGSAGIDEGLRRSRQLLLDLQALDLPLATEALNPLALTYLEDLISWTAIGARTTESQVHREMASGLPMPVGFKNGTDGGYQVAVNAMQAAARPHHALGVDSQGQLAMHSSAGNPDTHLVLRGGRGLTNYDAESIAVAQATLQKQSLNPRLVVDCSHDNARKDALRQPLIAAEVVRQRLEGNRQIVGLMLESFLEDGRQEAGIGALHYGQSITDPCLGWEKTAQLILETHGQLSHRGGA